MKAEPEPLRKRKYLIRPAESEVPRVPREASDGGGRPALPGGRPPLDLDQVALERHGRSREELIRESAHGLAARRGFRGGDPVADWLAAEAEIDARLCDAEGR